MEPHGKITAPDTVRFERVLSGSIDKVWSYLTDSEKRGKWLAKGEMELFEGGKATLKFLHAELSPVPEQTPEKYKDLECGHGFNSTVLQCKPPHLLSFTWNDGSEVTIELKEQGEKVLLTLTHRKLADNTATRVSVCSGWHTHLGILKAVLEDKIPEGFWTVQGRLEEEYSRSNN